MESFTALADVAGQPGVHSFLVVIELPFDGIALILRNTKVCRNPLLAVGRILPAEETESPLECGVRFRSPNRFEGGGCVDEPRISHELSLEEILEPAVADDACGVPHQSNDALLLRV